MEEARASLAEAEAKWRQLDSRAASAVTELERVQGELADKASRLAHLEGEHNNLAASRCDIHKDR